MKASIAIALIICGTFIVLAPPMYDYCVFRSLVSIGQSRDDLLMAPAYKLALWLLGTAMVGIAILMSIQSARPEPHRVSAAV